jgi:CubicO group peptidase (beta-lactamase class C family)
MALTLCLSGCGTLSSNHIDLSARAMHLAVCGAPLWQQVDALALPQLQQTPGISIAVLDAQGGRQLFNYGYLDSSRKAPVTSDTRFAIGSLSKGFTAEATAWLVQHQQLNWQDNLGTLLPDPNALSTDAQRITLEQLATHSAGLPRQITNSAMLARLVDYLFTGAPFYQDLDRGDYRRWLAGFHRPPQPQVVYSNLGYALLDRAVLLKSGQPPQSWVEKQILQPLAMRHTGYQPDTLPDRADRAVGHAGDQPKFVPRGQRVPDWLFHGDMVGAAALWSTSSDLLRYAQAHLQGSGDATLDAAFQDAMRVRITAPGHDAAALGWLQNTLFGQQILYQSGFIGGFASYIGLDRRHGTAVVVLQNSFNWRNDIGHRLLLRLAEQQDHPCTTASVALPDAKSESAHLLRRSADRSLVAARD